VCKWDWVGGEPFWKISITNIYKCQTLLGWKRAESHRCKVLTAHQVQIGRVFTLLVVLTFSIDLSGVNGTKTEFIP
jgi:hypothetical protein